MELVLVHPEIPHNSGCAARLAAASGQRLHLVEPLGFSLADRYLKRAGLDYWPQVDLLVHPDWEACRAFLAADSHKPWAQRLHLFTARGGRSLFASAFERDDVLVFGCESKGLPEDLLAAHENARVYIPILPGVRSLNLANAVALATYTALDRAGGELPVNDGCYERPQGARSGLRPQEIARRLERID